METSRSSMIQSGITDEGIEELFRKIEAQASQTQQLQSENQDLQCRIGKLQQENILLKRKNEELAEANNLLKQAKDRFLNQQQAFLKKLECEVGKEENSRNLIAKQQLELKLEHLKMKMEKNEKEWGDEVMMLKDALRAKDQAMRIEKESFNYLIDENGKRIKQMQEEIQRKSAFITRLQKTLGIESKEPELELIEWKLQNVIRAIRELAS